MIRYADPAQLFFHNDAFDWEYALGTVYTTRVLRPKPINVAAFAVKALQAQLEEDDDAVREIEVVRHGDRRFYVLNEGYRPSAEPFALRLARGRLAYLQGLMVPDVRLTYLLPFHNGTIQEGLDMVSERVMSVSRAWATRAQPSNLSDSAEVVVPAFQYRLYLHQRLADTHTLATVILDASDGTVYANDPRDYATFFLDVSTIRSFRDMPAFAREFEARLRRVCLDGEPMPFEYDGRRFVLRRNDRDADWSRPSPSSLCVVS